MKIHCKAALHFDGDRMAIEVLSLAEAGTTTVFYDHNDVGARVIEFLRAKSLDVYDRRGEANGRGLPVEVEPAPAPTQPIFGGDVESHHVKHSPPTEIKL
jgi:hypothetical protein